jgi:serine/threonine protein kinase
MVCPYMDHDLSGMTTNPDISFTEAQIKCYMLQLLEGLRYLHDSHILHRDMKGNLHPATFVSSVSISDTPNSCKHSHQQPWSTPDCRFRSRSTLRRPRSSARPRQRRCSARLHNPRRHTMVPSSRASPAAEAIHSSHRHVGRWVPCSSPSHNNLL